MKKFIVLVSLIFISLTPNAQAADAVQFTKSAYGALIALDQKSAGFSQIALDKFKGDFNFDTFAHLCMQDFETNMTAEEAQKLKQVFGDVFFANFFKNMTKIVSRRIAKPIYTIKLAEAKQAIVNVSGASPSGNITITFHLEPDTVGEWKMVDLEIDSVLLSRNYRGSFNRIFREQGFAGLYERLNARLKELVPSTST